MITIQNEYLSASVKLKGAELCSIVKNGKEYIWQADSIFWGRHAPNLFPIVGKLKNNQYEDSQMFFDNHILQVVYVQDVTGSGTTTFFDPLYFF